MTKYLGKSLRNNASQCPRRLRREMHNRARDLQAEFPGRNGFSAPNLWFMRQFCNEYSDKPKLQSLIGEISWAKNQLIMVRYDADGRFGVGGGQQMRLSFQIEKRAGLHLLQSPLSADQTVVDTDTQYEVAATVVQTLLLNRWINSLGVQVQNMQKLRWAHDRDRNLGAQEKPRRIVSAHPHDRSLGA